MKISEIIRKIKEGDDPIIQQLHHKEKFVDTEWQDQLAAKIREDPKYRQVILKLGELTDKRETLQRQLAKTEIDIDACLVLLGMSEEKERIDGGIK